MPPQGRVGDTCAGHPGWPPTSMAQGSPNVMCNGKPATRKGDSAQPHSIPHEPPCTPSLIAGSGSVFINGKPASRQGDGLSDLCNLVAGSPNVMTGG